MNGKEIRIGKNDPTAEEYTIITTKHESCNYSSCKLTCYKFRDVSPEITVIAIMKISRRQQNQQHPKLQLHASSKKHITLCSAELGNRRLRTLTQRAFPVQNVAENYSLLIAMFANYRYGIFAFLYCRATKGRQNFV